MNKDDQLSLQINTKDHFRQ